MSLVRYLMDELRERWSMLRPPSRLKELLRDWSAFRVASYGSSRYGVYSTFKVAGSSAATT